MTTVRTTGADAFKTLLAARDEYMAAYRAHDQARQRKAWSEVRKLDRDMTAALERFNALQASARTAFAKSRDWRHDKRQWTYVPDRVGEHSRRVIKYPEFYRDKEGSTVGLITHSAAKPEEIAAYAARNGYNAELLPFSWAYPSTHIAVLLTLKAGVTWKLN